MIPLRIAAAAAGLLLVAPAAAQPPEVPPPPLPAPSGPVLKAGTRVPMRTREPLSSKTARQGQRFDLEVTEPVLVDGLVVVPLGARGVGEVRRVVEKGMFGKAGKIEVQLLFVEAGGTRIRLGGRAKDKGASGAAAVAIGLPLVGISSAFVSGTSARIPAGTPIDGYVYQDLPLRPAA
ncbi:MAG: hypothetical protein JOZ90_10740 [Alphaproteobacteria bacterium]|nr:hypothetical protein [Alphaproteobacteria bacterium]MBV9371065.1 hypothetical protein [Alphaproteobacteria bacterium]MBV9901561.1 hypothetical protein [Alphaproteobacteria bacterium]